MTGWQTSTSLAGSESEERDAILRTIKKDVAEAPSLFPFRKNLQSPRSLQTQQLELQPVVPAALAKGQRAAAMRAALAPKAMYDMSAEIDEDIELRRNRPVKRRSGIILHSEEAIALMDDAAERSRLSRTSISSRTDKYDFDSVRARQEMSAESYDAWRAALEARASQDEDDGLIKMKAAEKARYEEWRRSLDGEPMNAGAAETVRSSGASCKANKLNPRPCQQARLDGGKGGGESSARCGGGLTGSARGGKDGETMGGARSGCGLIGVSSGSRGGGFSACAEGGKKPSGTSACMVDGTLHHDQEHNPQQVQEEVQLMLPVPKWTRPPRAEGGHSFVQDQCTIQVRPRCLPRLIPPTSPIHAQACPNLPQRSLPHYEFPTRSTTCV